MALKHEFMSYDSSFRTQNTSRNMLRVKNGIRRGVSWISLNGCPFSMFQNQTMKPGGYKEMSSILANQ